MSVISGPRARKAPTVLLATVASLAALTAVKPAISWAEETGSVQNASGVVFEDRNRNGRQDAAEPGVPDVSVSNGRDVVSTDEEGRYSIGVDEQTIVFVTQPAGYTVPVDEHQLPQFYYIHYPDGSPVETRYPGIAPTGPMPESIDFALHRSTVGTDFTALLFADPQTRTLAELEDLRADVVEELDGSAASFGITAGDVVNDPLDLFGPHNEIVSTLGIPWWNLPGNHDMNYDVPDDTYSTETYKSVYGPTDYSFEYGDVHFVNLDNIDYLGQGRGYRGYLDPRRLEWLANDLARVPADKLIVISTHIPLRTEAIGNQAQNTVNLQELFDILEGREHVFSTAGHDTSNSWQMYLEPGEERPTPPGAQSAVWNGPKTFHHQVLAEVRGGGWKTGPTDERGIQAADMADGNPNGYYFLSVDGHKYRMRYKPASLPASFQSRITMRGGVGNQELADGTPVWIPSGASGSKGISPTPWFAPADWRSAEQPVLEVNVFDGGIRHRVEARFDSGRFTPMENNPPVFGLTDGQPGGNLDTYIRTLRENLPGPERPVNPQPSSHIWTLPIPDRLGPGPHKVTVRSVDPYGRTSIATQRFEIRVP